MLVARLTASLALGVLVSACGRTAVEPSRTINEIEPVLFVAFGDASANGQFSGTVIGHPLVGDSTAVGGATIVLYAIPVVSGTQGAPPNQQPDSIGTVTAGADGEFELAKIPAGLYALRVIPPTSSSYAATDLWELVSDGKSSVTGRVGVYP